MQTRSKYTLSLILFIVIGLPSFGHDDREDEEDSVNMITELDAILEKSKSVNCLPQRSYRNISALDENHLLFIGISRAWVNWLPKKCSSLHRRATFTFEQWSNRVCKNAAFTSSRPGEIGKQCRLGKFYKIEKRIAERLKDAALTGVFD